MKAIVAILTAAFLIGFLSAGAGASSKWWFELDNSDTGFKQMDIFHNGQFVGKAERLDIGHKVFGYNSWPTVAALYSNAYLRLKQAAYPDVPFGTSFILGPSYWASGSYYHAQEIGTVNIIDGLGNGKLVLKIKAQNEHFLINYAVVLQQPTDKTADKMIAEVTQKYKAKKSLAIDSSRQAENQGFKLVQFSSMYVDSFYHDADSARYIDETGSTVTGNFNASSSSRFIFQNPNALGSTWLELSHSDDSGWQGNTPNCRVELKAPIPRITPQGWFDYDINYNNDNIGMWLNQDNVSSFAQGEEKTLSYRLVCQDNPKNN